MIALEDATALYPSLLAYVSGKVDSRTVAEDIVQEAYLRMMERPPRSESTAQFRRWINRVCDNLVVDHYRQPVIESYDIDRCQVCGAYEARCGCCG